LGTNNSGSSIDLRTLTQILPNITVAFVKKCIQTKQNCKSKENRYIHIPIYNNFEKGACIFYNENSWFNHDDNIKENESENKDVVQQIAKMEITQNNEI
jgi:hypothetical protein